MKISLFVVCAAAFLSSGAVAADEVIVAVDEDTNESTPIELSAAQMDQITAGTLVLPNGNTQHDDFDNPAPNVNGYLGELLGLCDTDTGAFCHPALTRRSDRALSATAGKGNQVTPFGNDGPWSATIASDSIGLCGPTALGFPACP
jgi:hypothetical protein